MQRPELESERHLRRGPSGEEGDGDKAGCHGRHATQQAPGADLVLGVEYDALAVEVCQSNPRLFATKKQRGQVA